MLWFDMDDWNSKETMCSNKLTEMYNLWWDLTNALYFSESFYTTGDSVVNMSGKMPADFNKI